jgi:hypothetical protein
MKEIKQRNRKRMIFEVNSRMRILTGSPLFNVNLLVSESLIEKTLQSFMYKPTTNLENVQRNKKKKKREKLIDVKLAPTRCQNLCISRTNHL